MVLVDQARTPHEVEQQFDPVATDSFHIRFLGDRKGIEASTTHWDKEAIDRGEKLERWADALFRLQSRRLSRLVYVNNHHAGHAPATTRRLQDLFHSKLSAK